MRYRREDEDDEEEEKEKRIRGVQETRKMRFQGKVQMMRIASKAPECFCFCTKNDRTDIPICVCIYEYTDQLTRKIGCDCGCMEK